MKRFIVSVLLLSLVVAICMWGTNFVYKNYEKITEEINLGEELAEDGEFERAREHFIRAERLYVECEQYMAAFVNHGTLDDIGQALSAVAPLSDKDSENEMLSALYEAKTALDHLRNDHKFLIGNLF